MSGPGAAVRLSPVAVNLAGVVESPAVGTPYRIDSCGRPYVPVGDGGVVLDLHLGDPVAGRTADHAAPGATLAHPDAAARFALTAYSCIGNSVWVRDGAAAGMTGWVVGKRGEEGRVVVALPDHALARLQPGDSVAVRASGQGAALPDAPDRVQLLNLDPRLLAPLEIRADAGRVAVGVRAVVPSVLAGNGVGRPAQLWDIDLAFPADDLVLAALRLGDLLAVSDLDVRYNVGYRRGWITVGVVVHSDSPQPGHGPGLTAVLTGPAAAFALTERPDGPVALTWATLEQGTAGEDTTR